MDVSLESLFKSRDQGFSSALEISLIPTPWISSFFLNTNADISYIKGYLSVC